ncbi:acyl-CoA dehydratase activase [Paramaledivibacter caminithermalis]|jgi:predicted CoA-substrate-specific enzyme activase|uniref:CoA-substrate-specific enzyme activase, putative n=1 Tax=Paramaledivibacter caminithermalis (strain DSM 15212 / CIP 107654 / DViRD3) TaxID=1121301 RepID=A0A1M6SIH4_PARC5|nr:acyl-CoA dehydratase activase [Paramaledivibacter caminithermalis]SHK44460.1 CoA-substrate-specific enzyme activase, putative [Paramaledivibacter caminithermalis DSM 15212]
MKEIYLGVDVGSVSTNIVAMDSNKNIVDTLYIRTKGKPIEALKMAFMQIKDRLQRDIEVLGVGTTGSGRHLAAIMLGADIVKNEITAHGVAALNIVPDVKTIIEIGGQDSKIILLRDGIVYDFAMNTVCAAGTGSFLDRQAERLGIPIEEFGTLALKSKSPVRIAGRCAVFAESDMIHKQQLGHNQEDIINGLCEAMARNYLNNLGKGKEIKPPVIFQGGVAANIGIKRAFEKILGCNIIVPKYANVMGAIGACLLAKDEVANTGKTKFLGLDIADSSFNVKSFECERCPNMCEVVEFYRDKKLVARWGDKCGSWGNIQVTQDNEKLA